MIETDKYDKWFKEEIEWELNQIPKEIIAIAKRNDNAREIVLQSITRKLCFDPRNERIRELFNESLISKTTQS